MDTGIQKVFLLYHACYRQYNINIFLNLPVIWFTFVIYIVLIRILRNGTLVINESKSTDEGQYLCKAKNGVGEGMSKLAEVTINGKTYWIK